MKVTKDILIRGGVSLKSRHNEEQQRRRRQSKFQDGGKQKQLDIEKRPQKQSLPLSKCKVANTTLI